MHDKIVPIFQEAPSEEVISSTYIEGVVIELGLEKREPARLRESQTFQARGTTWTESPRESQGPLPSSLAHSALSSERACSIS